MQKLLMNDIFLLVQATSPLPSQFISQRHCRPMAKEVG
jgi:hypothetical protein